MRLLILSAKRRKKRKRANEEQYESLKKEFNFLQREMKRSKKHSEKIIQSKLIASAQNKGSNTFWRAVKALFGDSKK